MSAPATATNPAPVLKAHGDAIDLLRLSTAGSVDDGKSTLIGRMLYDSGNIYGDQLESVKKASKGRGNGDIDFSLLTDGLAAEREQGITIDVAYRYFSTEKRRFIIADVPGHEQYTRNMVTGASTSNVALILVDARKGMLVQSKRHLFLASLLGIPHILVVINKMDLVDYDEKVFEDIKHQFEDFSAKLNVKELQFIPVSALAGDMVVNRGENMPWYGGTTMIDYMERVPISGDENLRDFRLPVQTVIRPNQDERWYAGRVEGGIVRKGDVVRVMPSGKTSRVAGVTVSGAETSEAFCPQSAAISLEDEIDISRGDTIVREKNVPHLSNAFEATVSWMSEEPMRSRSDLLMKMGTRTVGCRVDALRYEIDVNTLHRDETASVLPLNGIGRIEISAHEPLVFDAYLQNRNTGSFILIDPSTNATVAAGMIVRSKEKKAKVSEGEAVTKAPVVWLTGLSGSGKSTIADALSALLEQKGVSHEKLDGDVMREAFGNDLGFAKGDRQKNLDRAGYMAHMLQRNGVPVIASFITPYENQRSALKKRVGETFVEAYVNTSLEACEKRDVKGMYAKARAGEIENFTGVSDPFEEPENADIVLETENKTPEENAQELFDHLVQAGLVRE